MVPIGPAYTDGVGGHSNDLAFRSRTTIRAVSGERCPPIRCHIPQHPRWSKIVLDLRWAADGGNRSGIRKYRGTKLIGIGILAGLQEPAPGPVHGVGVTVERCIRSGREWACGSGFARAGTRAGPMDRGGRCALRLQGMRDFVAQQPFPSLGMRRKLAVSERDMILECESPRFKSLTEGRRF
jgi:hypothetical protein